ncbi:MAG TPA: sigma-54 dependent transcriptional regulator [Bryobacteraceae bacterium]|nr:sigma-54 dependent transcriptional regulator [Bryobacteraceae bacterium]HOQ44476.1 sigma-54 dependent transcriptional regulator [Bryobacteraceae bacterium]HPQ16157.1 sigma-54 dependent transcriptional regulator [Bryobacteraceae bacterium]HPU70795.1 sigma-54 dependent transcriptional regulator [Bryobacteraceae bacterium]
MSEEKLSILIVDDEEVVRDSLVHWFTEEGYDVDSSASAPDALSKLAGREFDLVIADIRMPGMDGIELLEKIRSEQLDTSVIVMTGYASVETAVRALKHGAFDYITKPFDPDDLSVVVRNALEQHRLKRENRMLRQQLTEEASLNELIGGSDAMRRVREQIETVAGVDSTVLIEGESGTGKELVARAIHRLSPRRYNPMVVVHCGALTETLIESELFGHEKGAFTGAQYRKKGKFEAAMGGTVFLDEIADISLKTQTDLLRVLQEREIVRVGGTQAIKVDFRVIAASNRNLAEIVKEGKFRSDLFYRLNVFTIHLPPLRERHGDIPLLATHFLDKYSTQMNRKFTGFDRAAMDMLIAHNWPGNVRELENIVERAVVVGHEPLIRAHDLALPRPAEGAEDLSLESVERRHIVRVLEDFGWNQTQAAKALGIDRVTLYHKIRRYGLKPPAKAARV